MNTVLILGMHRSGTSCLAGSLQQHGLYLGQVFEANPHNLKGNRENSEIMQLNDLVLSYNDFAWNNPPYSNLEWTDEHQQRRDHIIQKYNSSQQLVWGFKDPRTLFTLEFWLEGMSGFNINYVGSFRHPALVAQSMWNRDKMPILDGLELWKKYNTRLLSLYKKNAFPLISFDLPLKEYQNAIYRILQRLGIQTPENPVNIFFDESLRHEIINSELELPKNIKTIYKELTEIYQEQLL